MSPTERSTVRPEDTSARSIRFLSSQSLYGYADDSAPFISASRSTLPEDVSMSIIFPGLSLPDSLTSPLSRGMTPASDARMNIPSLVTVYLTGRRPFLSSIPPASIPSVNSTAAGPSHGSM